MDYTYFNKIRSPLDIKELTVPQIKTLASEIRDFLVQNVLRTGGHLASNLGVVELTLALYKIFDTPRDKIIWDVGHQSYVAKILTGRREVFGTLREENGIGGFPKRSESEYDAFGTGHSSTSLSAALGMATANKLTGSDAYTVAIVGDGAFTGGLIYEALNNCSPDLKLIVILNENEMSISPSVGNTAHILSRIRSKENYFRVKNAVLYATEHIPFIGEKISRGMRRLKKALKNAIFNSNIVESYGFTYFGPIDGNDYATVERLILQAKKHGGSAFIHIKTRKGKGYAPAEKNPSAFHAVKPEIAPKQETTFSAQFGQTVTALAKENEKLCVITAAMKDGTGLCDYFKAFPNRAFDVGIAEGHAVTFAAGLAAQGLLPLFAVYSTFLQRSYDNILHDLALQHLPCVFAVDRAGFAPDDGATHHGVFDVSIFSLIPGATVFAPLTYDSLADALKTATEASDGIYAVRYAKGAAVSEGICKRERYIWTDETFPEKPEALIVTYGRIYLEALKAKAALDEKGVSTGVLVLEKLTPYADTYRTIRAYANGCQTIVLLEEGVESGGFAQNLLDVARRASDPARYHLLAIRSDIPGHARLETLYRKCGISCDDIVKEVCMDAT